MALTTVVSHACEDMWGLVNAVAIEEDVTQDQVNEWYRRWKRMPTGQVFVNCKYWVVAYVPMRDYTNNGKQEEADEFDDRPEERQEMDCE